MKIEIKKLKTARGHETDAFSCDVHVDGDLVAHVTQAGQGGPHRWGWTIEGRRGICDALVAQFESERPQWSSILYPEDWTRPEMQPEILDLCVWSLVTLELENRALARQCPKKTLYRLRGDEEGSWRVIVQPFSPAMRPVLVTRYGDMLLEIANERFA